MRKLFSSNRQETKDSDDWNKGNTPCPKLDKAFLVTTQGRGTQVEHCSHSAEGHSLGVEAARNATQGTKEENVVREWRA